MAVEDLCQDFAEGTTMHGVLRVAGRKRKNVCRMVWLTLLLIASGVFIYQAQLLVKNFLSYPTHVTTQLKFGALAFPSITICNNNPLQVGKLMNNTELMQYEWHYRWLISYVGGLITVLQRYEIEKICKTSPTLCDGIQFLTEEEAYYAYHYECGPGCVTNETADDDYCSCDDDDFYYNSDLRNLTSERTKNISISVMQINSKVAADIQHMIKNARDRGDWQWENYRNSFQPIEEFIKDCSFNGKKCNLGKHFYPDFHNPHYGVCFIFNYKDAEVTNDVIARVGVDSGLRMILNVNQSQYLPTTDTAGVRVSINHKKQFPFPEVKGYNAPVNERTSIGLQMIENHRLRHPYGNCQDSIYEETQNYFYSGNYTTQGCIFSCTAIEIAKTCNCIPLTYNAPPGVVTLKLKNGTTITVNGRDINSCDSEKLKRCADDVEIRFLNNPKSIMKCGCPPPCGGQLGLWLGMSILSIAEFLSLFTSIVGYTTGYTNSDIEKKFHVQTKYN